MVGNRGIGGACKPASVRRHIAPPTATSPRRAPRPAAGRRLKCTGMYTHMQYYCEAHHAPHPGPGCTAARAPPRKAGRKAVSKSGTHLAGPSYSCVPRCRTTAATLYTPTYTSAYQHQAARS
eukprot:scaffold9874_cov116-Isochrysis_galbana.AAC.1